MRASIPILIATLAVVPVAAFGQVISGAPEHVSVVVYPGADANARYGASSGFGQGLVMVTEQRAIDIPAGATRINFRGVAEGIVPQTVSVQGLAEQPREQNFEYDLLTPSSLLSRSEGREVRLVRTDRATGEVTEERARVVSGANGVVLDIQGRIEALRCSGAPEKLVLDGLPPGFTDRPTLSIEVVSPQAGKRTVTLSYLATGMSWAAQYVAHINPGGRTMDLLSWVTIANRSNTSFSAAPTQVLAGAVKRNPTETRPVQVYTRPLFPSCWGLDSGLTLGSTAMRPAPPPPALADVGQVVVTVQRRTQEAPVVVEDLGDNKLYSLPEPLTLAAYQTKQLALFQRPNVSFRKLYRCELDSLQEDAPSCSVRAVAQIDNKKSAGLGLALPMGRAAVFEVSPQGRAILVGEDAVRDTPVGLPLEISLGAGFGVNVERRLLYPRNGAEESDRRRITVELRITNAKPEAVAVQIREAQSSVGLGTTVAKESVRHTLENGRVQWEVRVPANGTTTLTYTLQ